MFASYYQQGTIERVTRTKSPDVWVFRWRESDSLGKRVQRKKIIGDINRYKNKAAATRVSENIRFEINPCTERRGQGTIQDLWGHFQQHELRNPNIDRSPTTIDNYLVVVPRYLLPEWGDSLIVDVKPVAMERWL